MQYKTFVINLERRKDRLDQLRIPFEYEVFRATDGREQFPDEILKMQGHLGCWDSHRRLLEKIKKDEYMMAMVLEDDVEIDDQFSEKLDKYLGQLPEDWDLLYLGGHNVAKEIKRYSENLNIAEMIYTTHAYIINAKFVPILIEVINSRRYKIDVVFCDALKRGKCYIANPVLAWQREGYSDITRSVNSNDHLR